MKFKSMKSFHALSAWAVAGMLIVASGQSAAAQSTNSDAKGIEGTWSVTVTPNDCTSCTTPLEIFFATQISFPFLSSTGARISC